MSKVLRFILMLISIITSVVITASYLYFILYPLKYLISIFLGKYGLPQEISQWLHIACVAVLVILGQIHAYKWHIRHYSIKNNVASAAMMWKFLTKMKSRLMYQLR